MTKQFQKQASHVGDKENMQPRRPPPFFSPTRQMAYRLRFDLRASKEDPDLPQYGPVDAKLHRPLVKKAVRFRRADINTPLRNYSSLLAQELKKQGRSTVAQSKRKRHDTGTGSEHENKRRSPEKRDEQDDFSWLDLHHKMGDGHEEDLPLADDDLPELTRCESHSDNNY